MELISTKTNINFLSKAKYAIALSTVLIAYSLFLWFSMGDTKYGVDYTGGNEFIISAPSASTDQIRTSLKASDIDGAVVQEFEKGSGEYSIRLSANFQDTQVLQDKILTSIKSIEANTKILSSNFVGPTIGEELRRSAMIAIIIGLIGMLAYISYRFEFAFALGAVVALTHDVIISLGVYLFFDLPLSMATLAAAMSIVGYSVNDTIIIFDRVREEMTKRKEFVLDEVVNYSVNATLSRTIITSLLTLFSALALYVFGGGAIKELALFLVAGIIVGSYSTIFIASPVALAWEKWRAGK